MERRLRYNPHTTPKPAFSLDNMDSKRLTATFTANSNVPEPRNAPYQSGFHFSLQSVRPEGTLQDIWFTLSDDEMQLLFLAYQESRKWLEDNAE